MNKLDDIEKTYHHRIRWAIAWGVVIFSLIALQAYLLITGEKS